MNYSVPGYLTPVIVTGMITIIATVLLGLNRALRRHAALPQKEWLEEDRSAAFWGVAALLVGWFVVAFATSSAGFYAPATRGVPTIQYGLSIPIVLGLLLFRAWPLIRRIVAVIPNSWLVGVQFYRALGVIFLTLYASGHLPGLFAFPAGIGDVLVGILAPFVANAYARSPEGAKRRVRLWNWLGITDLTVAVTIGFLTSPSPLQIAAFDHPSGLIAMFPLVLIPVFAVPLSILLHLASLQKLRQKLPQDQVAGYRAQRIEQIAESGQRATG